MSGMGARRARAFVSLLAAVLLLAACNGRPGLTGPADLPTLAPTAAATTAVAATTATPPAGSPTALVPPTPAATLPPTFTPGPSPTPEPAALLVAGGAPWIKAIMGPSDGPEGLPWRAEVLVYDCAAVGDDPQPISLEILRLIKPEEGVEYQIDSQLINCGGLGAFGLQPLAWDSSGRYFWYTTAREGGPDGACRPWARPMTRVDLADWAFTTLDQAATAPDGSRVAGWVNGELVVFALDGGELGRLAPAALPPTVSAPVWSPDGSALAYLQYTSACGETPGDSAVVVVNTNTYEQRVVLTQASPELESVNWLDPGHLILAGLLDAGQWQLDLATGTTVPVTPTPTP